MLPATNAFLQESLTKPQKVLLDRLARRIVRLGLGPVASLFIESARPLNFVGSQLLHFFAPFVHAFGQFPDYDLLAGLLEDRDSIDRILEAIEKEETLRAQVKAT